MGQKDSNLNDRRNLLRPLSAFFLWPTNARLDLLPPWQSWTGQLSMSWSWVVGAPLSRPISLTPLSSAHTCFTSFLPYPVCVSTRGAQSCLTLCDPTDCSPPGSSVHARLFQARILEHRAISSSQGSFQPWDQTHICCIGRQILYHWATKEAPSSDYFTFTLHHFNHKISFYSWAILINLIWHWFPLWRKFLLEHSPKSWFTIY